MTTALGASLEDVAQLGAKDSVYRWTANRHPAHKIVRLWKFKLSEFDKWVRAGGSDADTDDKGGAR